MDWDREDWCMFAVDLLLLGLFVAAILFGVSI